MLIGAPLWFASLAEAPADSVAARNAVVRFSVPSNCPR